MTDMELHADVAVLCRNRDLKSEAVKPLYERQIGFQYLPESVWADCREENGALLCRGRRYGCVLGAAELFSSVPHTPEAAEPDCVCDPPQPDLRCARFVRAGRDCWFLVNEGNQELRTILTLPINTQIGRYDLWTGERGRCETIQSAGKAQFMLRLPVRGSILLFSCTPEEWGTLPEAPMELKLTSLQFELIGQDAAVAKKEYRAVMSVSREMLSSEMLTLELDAEEMAELYVNGQFAGVGFWPPQRFDLKPFLREGENALLLTVTGSLANVYGDRAVWYGLRDQPSQHRF